MKRILITTIAAVVLVGCGGPSSAELSLLSSASDGNIEDVKKHLAAGEDVNAKDMLYITPLHAAAREGHKEVVELLITAGADVNAQTEWGATPIDSAMDDFGRKHPEIADLLRKHGGKTGEELKAEEK